MDVVKYHILTFLELNDSYHLCTTNRDHYELWGDEARKRDWKIKKSLEIPVSKFTPCDDVMRNVGYEKVDGNGHFLTV